MKILSERAYGGRPMTKVFVSGCYDILHAGHIQFFRDARALGDYLVVSFASQEVLALYKNRESSIPDDNKIRLLAELRCVDKVYTSSDLDPIFDFKKNFLKERPDILAVTEDDKNKDAKREFCQLYGVKLVVLTKKNPSATPVSTTTILNKIRKNEKVPLRIDIAGGWLDVPKFSRKGSFIVNCAIEPLVSLSDWPYEHEKGAGLGNSAAKAILEVRNGLKSELEMGVGWQDPAIIMETGLCSWRSGLLPELDIKTNPQFLKNSLALYWTGTEHSSVNLVDRPRDYKMISLAGKIAASGVKKSSRELLALAIRLSYFAQLKEGMAPLPNFGELAKKYCGSGHGGYAFYLFTPGQRPNNLQPIEPYLKNNN